MFSVNYLGQVEIQKIGQVFFKSHDIFLIKN